jgi:hypothetical protein
MKRYIRSSSTSNKELKVLLANVFAAELNNPSRILWIASPWISDIPILDNRAQTFSGFGASWEAKEIHLAEVLLQLVRMGTHINIIVRPVTTNDTFRNRLNEMLKSENLSERAKVFLREDLHLKGIVGDSFVISGSMNVTNNGINVYEEGITIDIDPAVVSQWRVDLRNMIEGTDLA